MTTEEFKNTWTKNGDALSPLTPSRLTGFNLQPATVKFLTTSGLPFDAAPYLSFAQDKDDIFYGINKLTDQYDFLESEHEKYVVIGSCDGDPIAINTDKNDEVEWLDHEDLFSSRFFNTSLMAMADCLVAYRDFVSTVQKENEEDAFMNFDFTDEQFEKLKQHLKLADNRALTEEGFWKKQLEMELILRQDARDKK